MRESNQPKSSEPRRPSNAGGPPRRMPQPQGGRPRPQRMRLPFEQRPFDIGMWIYEHRVGLCCMVVAYLAFGIIFVSTKIVLNAQKYDNTLYVDLTELQQQLMEEERLNQQLQQEEEEESTPLRNRVSDVHGGAESVGRWDESTQEPSESESDFQESLDEEAAAVASRLRASREAFEKGRREEQEMIDRHKAQREAKEGEQESGVKQQGNVLVEYDLPGRRDVSLFIPAYLCEGSGRVVVSITVNRNGKVTAASVKESSGSSCINDSAVRAARNSTFNVDPSRDKQSGTITYRFVPQ